MAAKEKPKKEKPKKEKPPKKSKKGEAEAKKPDEETKDGPPPGEGEDGAGGGEGEAPAKKKLSGKTLILFIALPVLLILGGGGAAGYFLLFNKPPQAIADASKVKKHREKKPLKEGQADPVTEGEGVFYYALPEMLVNITSGDGRPVYLKLKLTLEAPNQDVVDAIEPQLPHVLDQYQAFLRELRVDDLAGSAGAYRLRLELLRRANLAIAPAQINAVLIEEMLVQ